MNERSIERLLPEQVKSEMDYLIFLRHVFVYEWVKEKLSGRVLEIGFGDGYGTDYLRKEGIDIVAVDVDEESVMRACEKYPETKFFHYDGILLPYPDKSFDCIISFQVIEHIQDDSAFLKEIYRVMKPGGVAYITTPNRKYRLKDDAKPWNPFHIREYSGSQLNSIASTIFDQVSISGVHGIGDVHQKEIDRVRHSKNAKHSRWKRWIPQWAKKVYRVVKPVRGAEVQDAYLDVRQYSTADYEMNEDVENSLDLVLVAKK